MIHFSFKLTKKKIYPEHLFKHFEDLLVAHPNYIRTHKSFLVNIKFITEYIKSDGGYLIVNGHHVSVNSTKISEITELLQNHKN
jgi:two-component system LytT family response regulator